MRSGYAAVRGHAVSNALAALWLLACGGGDERAPELAAGRDSASRVAGDSLQVSAGAAAELTSDTIRTAAVIYVLATDSEVEAARVGVSAEDFEVIADDLSYYRGSALAYLEDQGVPVVRMAGRRPLWFVIGDVIQRRDYADLPWLDLIIVYRPGASPDHFAPNEVDQAVEAFRVPTGNPRR